MTNINVRIWTRVRGVNEVEIYMYEVGHNVHTCDERNWRLEYEKILGGGASLLFSVWCVSGRVGGWDGKI